MQYKATAKSHSTEITMSEKNTFSTEHSVRIAYIQKHPLYISSYQRLQDLEQKRIFCRHQMDHLLDVARIAYILNLERGLGISKEVIYAAAILHDIGKGRQYEHGVPHEIASADIAEQIFADMPKEFRFTQHEQQQILTAIRGHRKLRKNAEPLETLLYESDKASRACFACPAEPECNWSTDKKNMEIRI